MSDVEVVGRKLNTSQRMEVLALIARGDTRKQINQHLDAKYGLTISATMIAYLKNRHADALQMMKDQVAQYQMSEAEELMEKSRKLMSKHLDRASEDFDELAELDRAYREGEMEYKDYANKKRTLLKLSLSELNQVSKDMHAQAKDAPADAPGTVDPSAAANTEALMKAIQSGDTIELQRIILNP